MKPRSMIYALDTNTISHLLRKDKKVGSSLQEAVDDGHIYVIPPMVYYEVKRWLSIKNATSKLANFDRLAMFTGKIHMNAPCWNKAIEIYVALAKRGVLIDDGDIFIAAYCIVNGCTLVTNNMNHFERIEDLQIVNWTN